MNIRVPFDWDMLCCQWGVCWWACVWPHYRTGWLGSCRFCLRVGTSLSLQCVLSLDLVSGPLAILHLSLAVIANWSLGMSLFLSSIFIFLSAIFNIFFPIKVRFVFVEKYVSWENEDFLETSNHEISFFRLIMKKKTQMFLSRCFVIFKWITRFTTLAYYWIDIK